MALRRQHRRSLVAVAVTLAPLVTLAACSDDPAGPDSARIVRIGVTGLADTIWANAPDTAVAAVQNGRGEVVDTAVVHWSSSDSSLFVVDGDGVVTARDAGDAWLRVEALGFVDSVRVRVDLRPVATPAPFVAYTRSYLGPCGLGTDGIVWCRSGGGWTEVPGGRRFRDVQGSQTSYCGLATDDVVYCWGSNDDGALGTGSRMPLSSATPLAAAGGRTFSQLSVGSHKAVCAIGMADSLAWCWGHNDYSQTGRRVSDAEPVAAPLPGAPTMLQVSETYDHGCGLAVDSSTWCWGIRYNARPEDFRGPREYAPPGRYRAVVSPGPLVGCGLLGDGRVECWITGDLVVRAPGTQVTTTARFVRLFGGGSQDSELGCGLTENGEWHCWDARKVALGEPSVPATRRVRNRTFRFVSHDGRCAITNEGVLYCP